MRPVRTNLFLVIAAAVLTACASTQPQHQPDTIEATLPVPADKVRAAVIDVLTADGYDVEEEDSGRLMTGYRREIRSPWDWMLRWRFGVGRSRVAATITPLSEESSQLTIDITYEGKDGILTMWERSPSTVPQSAANQLRLIKNALRLL